MSFMEALRAELGSDSAVLDQLAEDEAADLLALLDAARKSQQETLDEAIDAALGHLPKLVRVPARRIMFG